jgi:hypothetical protein
MMSSGARASAHRPESGKAAADHDQARAAVIQAHLHCQAQ